MTAPLFAISKLFVIKELRLYNRIELNILSQYALIFNQVIWNRAVCSDINRTANNIICT